MRQECVSYFFRIIQNLSLADFMALKGYCLGARGTPQWAYGLTQEQSDMVWRNEYERRTLLRPASPTPMSNRDLLIGSSS